MYSDWVWGLLGVGFTIWLGALSIVVWQDRFFLRSLMPKSGQRDVRKKFEEVVLAVSGLKADLDEAKKKALDLEVDGAGHIQKIGLLRYNPYQDTGGDQSFSIALLDFRGDGVVLTSLHTRTGTRVYGKPIVKGKGEKYKLSKEEEEVVKQAIQER